MSRNTDALAGAGSVLGPLAKLWRVIAPQPGEGSASGASRLQTATCALLLEVAWADDEFTEEERALVTKTMRERFSLSEELGKALVESAMAERIKRPDLWHFTHEINDACTREEKMEIVRELWRIVFSDGSLDAHEDYLMHRLAKLLNLSHPELIEAKLAAKLLADS